MKKKVVTLIIIAVISEIVALSGVFLILTSFNNRDNMVNAAVSNDDTANVMSAYTSIYGDKLPYYLNSHENEVSNKINTIEADIVIEEDKVLIKETLHSISTYSYSYIENQNDKTPDVPDVVFLYIPSLNTSTTNVKKIVQGEKTLNFEVDNLMLKIELSHIEANKNNDMIKTNNGMADITITIEYEILLNKSSGTISRTNSHIYLTNFLVTPVIFKDNEPVVIAKSRFGDPYIYNMNNYAIRFLVDDNVDIYAPGTKKEEPVNINNAKKYISFKAKKLRDFPAVILKDTQSSDYTHVVKVEKIRDTEVYFINSNKTCDFVKEAFTFASENIGPYPYEKLFIVENVNMADMNLRGMEFSNMIFLSESCFTNVKILRQVTYHEVFHQWFYGIIGTDQITEPFLDEGLVNYLAMYLAGEKIGNTYNSSFLNKSLTDYVSVKEYYDLAYDNATNYFASIHKELGNNFYEMLKKIYDDKKYTILYYNEFKNYVNMFTQFSQGGK